jgi:hypothetical protein
VVSFLPFSLSHRFLLVSSCCFLLVFAFINSALTFSIIKPPFTLLKRYFQAKKELWKLKYFAMQKYNLPKKNFL